MSNQQATLQALLKALESHVGTNFAAPCPTDSEYQESAITDAMEHNRLLIQRQLNEVAQIVHMKLAYIRELEKQNARLEEELKEVRKGVSVTQSPLKTLTPMCQ